MAPGARQIRAMELSPSITTASAGGQVTLLNWLPYSITGLTRYRIS